MLITGLQFHRGKFLFHFIQSDGSVVFVEQRNIVAFIVIQVTQNFFDTFLLLIRIEFDVPFDYCRSTQCADAVIFIASTPSYSQEREKKGHRK